MTGFHRYVYAQPNTINVHHLTTANGLADGVIRALGQDKYGYIWISSMSGLSRYDGYSVKIYQNQPGDTTGMPFGLASAILGDSKGDLWFGFGRALYRFNYSNEHFEKIPGSEFGFTSIQEHPNGNIILQTGKGMAELDVANRKIIFLKDQAVKGKELFKRRITDFGFCGSSIYMSSDSGIVIYNVITKEAVLRQIPGIPSHRFSMIAVSTRGAIWAAYSGNEERLVKTDTSFRTSQSFEPSFFPEPGIANDILSLFFDRKQRLWITTSTKGLLTWLPSEQRFLQYKDDIRRANSLSTSHYRMPFYDRDGFLWLASEGNGVDYFNPDESFFEVITPGEERKIDLLSLWARTVIEDNEGNKWFGTGGGLVRLSSSGQYTHWRNESGKARILHSNSIRSLLCDNNGDIWIGTSNGMNRFRRSTQQIEFLGEKDSLPFHFYWCMLKDSRNTIWFGGGRGLYYLDPNAKTAHSYSMHPVLSKLKITGVQSAFEDSKGNLWFGSNGGGLYYYEPATGKTHNWIRNAANDTTIIGNNITSITEDHDGIMWISSSLGLVSYDRVTNRFRQYTRKDGLSSAKTSCLIVDKRNRLWIGTAGGLLVLDSSRGYFRNFDINDGLPTMEFSDQRSTMLKDGRFVFPTMRGFVLFDPMAYDKKSTQVNTLLAGIKVFGKPYIASSNPEETASVRFGSRENFFSFELSAINFSNPAQTWYAYKLDGFDKDWIYTRNRIANYTNVPGGTYTFRYKATTDPNNWNVPEKTLLVHVGKPFFKQVWFWAMIVAIISVLLYIMYTYRLRQQQRVFALQGKAQLLEKEKALVQYESLKQQLNPHFLFNSLTSLSSLIRIDQQKAGDFLDKMSKTYRYILKNRESETVPVQDELRFVDMYITLQRTRFGNALQVNTNIPAEYLERRIAPVTLQNLVENAIKHNVADTESPLCIGFFIENDYLVVRNNLQKKNFVETSNRQGLANMRSLYNYLSERPMIVEDDGFYFNVKIPLL